MSNREVNHCPDCGIPLARFRAFCPDCWADRAPVKSEADCGCTGDPGRLAPRRGRLPVRLHGWDALHLAARDPPRGEPGQHGRTDTHGGSAQRWRE